MAKRNLAKSSPARGAAAGKHKLSKGRAEEDRDEEEDLNEDEPDEAEDHDEDENAEDPDDGDESADDGDEEEGGEDPDKDEDAEDDDDKEKARCKAIVQCKEAKGRRALAEKLAFDTRISVREAKSILAAAPRSGQSDPVAQAMGKIGNPALGAGGDGSGSAKNPLLASVQKHRPGVLRKQ